MASPRTVHSRSSSSDARKPDVPRDIAVNKKARHDYEVLDSWEVGIVLVGSEVKSLRAGRVNFGASYAEFEGGELWLVALQITEYAPSSQFGHAQQRRRKLLMHAAELSRLRDKVRDPGMTLVPLKLYFMGSTIKVELGLCRGKKDYDKRDSMKERDVKRELERAKRNWNG
jgi:SsrA-binding protein